MSATDTPIARYLAAEHGRAARLARECKVTPQAVFKWKRNVPADQVQRVVAATDGALSAHDLRPDLYPQAFAFPDVVANMAPASTPEAAVSSTT